MPNVRSFDDVLINYEIIRFEQSPVLFFLHGAGGSLGAWKEVRNLLHSKGISTLALDMRGHGLSERPADESDYALEAFAKDIKRVLEQEKITDFVLVGHCFGGMVSLLFDKLYHQKARGFVLIDASIKAPGTLTKIFRENKLAQFLKRKTARYNPGIPSKDRDYKKFIGTKDWDIKRLLSDIQSMSFKSWFFTYRNMALFNGEKILKSINQPILILHGDKDTIFPLEQARIIQRTANNAKLLVLKNDNHIVVLNNPFAIASSIYDFLKKLDI